MKTSNTPSTFWLHQTLQNLVQEQRNLNKMKTICKYLTFLILMPLFSSQAETPKNTNTLVSNDISTLIVSKRGSEDNGTQINENTPESPTALLQYTNVPKPKTGEGIRKQIFAQTGQVKHMDDVMKYSEIDPQQTMNL